MNDDKTITAKQSSHLQTGATLQNEKYRIDAFLASGGFGNTYRATHTDFNETVAIKEFFMKEVSQRDADSRSVSVSHPDSREKFKEQKEKFFKEARRIRKMKNSHIIEVIDLFEENNTAYYVMEYIVGGTLAERVKAKGVISEQLVCSYLHDIIDALNTVHASGYYHCDIKPSNIMIDDDRHRAVLIDFGASKQTTGSKGVTQNSALCYTPGYAPSEQEGQAHDKFGPWTDLYALGGTLYFAMTGKKPPRPFEITEEGDKAFAFTPNMSNDMRKIILWMMRQRRSDRPQSAQALFDFLQDAYLPTLGTGKYDESKPFAGPHIDDDHLTADPPRKPNQTPPDFVPDAEEVTIKDSPVEEPPVEEPPALSSSQTKVMENDDASQRPPQSDGTPKEHSQGFVILPTPEHQTLYSDTDEDDDDDDGYDTSPNRKPLYIGIIAGIVLAVIIGLIVINKKDHSAATPAIENFVTERQFNFDEDGILLEWEDTTYINEALYAVYTGGLDNGKPEGEGTLTIMSYNDKIGKEYTGIWEIKSTLYSGLTEGTVTCHPNDGNEDEWFEFTGTFDGLKPKDGLMTFKNGSYYEGPFDSEGNPAAEGGKWFDKDGNETNLK